MRKLSVILLLLSVFMGCATETEPVETVVETDAISETIEVAETAASPTLDASEPDNDTAGMAAKDTEPDVVADSIDENSDEDREETTDAEPESDLTPEEVQEALFTAIATQNVDDVRALIAQGADANKHRFGTKPLDMTAVLSPVNQEIIELLFEAGAEITMDAFHKAVANSSAPPELIQWWIDNGADIHEHDSNNEEFTALMVAASLDNVETGRLLLENGADINVVQKLGDPAISISSFFGHLEFTQMLVEEGADINILGGWPTGRTPLDWAVRGGQDEVAEYLRSVGAVMAESLQADDAPVVETTDTLTRTKISTTILSENTGIEYPVDIFLPVDYDESAEPYSIIYATDGQWLSDRYNKVLFDAGVPAVLISIHEGPNDRRQTDFGFPGVEDYFPFFRDELMPMVEAEYNVSPEQRTLVGQSAGGAFVWSVIVLQEIDEPLFDQLLIVDHGYWGTWDVEYKEKLEARYAADPAMPGKLVITGALLDWHFQPPDGGDEIVFNFTNEVNVLEEVFRDMEFEGLEISRFSYEVAHDNAPIPSFIDAVPIFFPEGQ